jgi:predicted SprT family Zn-dependent metalloprotease
MQLEFAWRDAESLRRDMETAMGARVILTITDNASTVMTAKPLRGGAAWELRLHHMFLGAGPDVIQALSRWVANGRSRKAGALVDAFIAEHRHLLREARPRRIRLLTQGTHHDLRRYYDEVNAAEFGDAVTAKITWGRDGRSRRRRSSIRFGSYLAEENLIRIHPALDQDFVPQYFVRYVVFHEMLHAHLGIDEAPNGRRRIHTPAFKRRERQYVDFERAMAWEGTPRNLHRLLR